MQFKYSVLQYKINDNLPLSYGHKLRGFFANNFDNILFHHHKDNGNYRYAYPPIQYKIIEGDPTIIGLEEGTRLIADKFLEVEKLSLGGQEYIEPEGRLKWTEQKVGVVEEKNFKYKFYSPWLALNQKNYQKYISEIKGDKNEKEKFLARILTGNILTFAKGINWWVEEEIKVQCSLEEREVKFKGQYMIGFTGEFVTNVCLPEYIGLGKSSARGFGTIVEI